MAERREKERHVSAGLDIKSTSDLFEAFAPHDEMRIFGRGIRRRIAPMLGDVRRRKMAFSLLFSLPGAPVLFYGDEIGMAENLEVEGRVAVRTPMQWSTESHGGFSSAPAERLRRPLPTGEHGPDEVNVARQQRDTGSFLSWMQHLVRRRRNCPEIGFGRFEVVETGHTDALALRFDWCGSTVLTLHNFSWRELACDLKLELPDDFIELFEVLSDGDEPPEPQSSLSVSLRAYGYRWFRMRRAGVRLPL